MDDFRIVVVCDNPEKVVAELSRDLALEFEGRESHYLGAYWTELPSRTLRILWNRDPLYKPGSDPPKDRYFEPAFPDHEVLVDVEGSTIGEQITSIVLERFPGSLITPS
jgi:hypothetical protein